MKSIYRTIIAAAGRITGGVLLPVVFKKSPKSENGTLESRAGWKGLCRKGMMLFFVLIAEKLDQLTQTNYLRDAVCIGFILNEAVSILENAGLMGVKIPEILRSRIDVLTTLPPGPMPAHMQERSTREIFRICRRIIT